MNTKRNVILVTAIVAVLLVAAVGSASADTEITQAMIPFTADTDGERYYLTGDLTCADTASSAITIDNNNIIIDGQGHKITGTVSGTDCAPWDTSQTYPAPHCGVINVADKDNVVIKNLELENFCTGIALGKRPGAGSVDNNTVTGCKIHDCGKSNVVTHGIQMVWTNNCNITKNEIYEIDGTGIAGGCSGGGNGIFLFGDLGPERGWYNSVTCNNLHHNNKSGFFTKHQCMHNTISYNNATYNNQSGIMPKCEKSNYNEFEYNNMSYNGVNGFYLGGDSNTIRYNTMINNGAEGLGLKGTADSNTITNNTACGNGGTGDMAWTDVTNIGNSNTCDSGPAGACDWNCGDSLQSVYYNFDGDNYYSNDPENCVCANAMNTGSCCNPGLFNSSDDALLQHCAGGVCILEPGTDPNDCDPAYILNWMTYPYKIWEQSNWSGPAVMQMMVDHYRPEEPTQAYLNATGIAHNHNCNSDLPYVDRYGMQWTLNYILHNTSSYGGGKYANYGNHATTDVENALHYICWWQSLGPGAVPAYTDYSNWMVVRGIHTDINPRDGSYSGPDYGYTIYGFWINDPNPAGIGENSYKCVNQFTENYYKAMQDQCDVTDGNWVAICEPPEVDAEITLADSPVRLEKPVDPELKGLDVVKAAIDGVNEELVPYDPEFAETFAKTIAGEPMLVTDDDGNEYYLVPFEVPVKERPIPIKKPVEIQKVEGRAVKLLSLDDGKAVIKSVPVRPIRPIKEERTLVVVLVDAADGSFKEASWVADPVKYLPVSKVEALKLVFKEMRQDRLRAFGRPVIELVHRDASPYSPDWKITIGQIVFYVSQDGTVSYDKPLPKPTLRPKPIKPGPIRIMPT